MAASTPAPSGAFATRATFTLLALLLAALAWAQTITVGVSLLPPYSPYVHDYADLQGRAVITLTNTSTFPVDLRLEGSLTNTSTGHYLRTRPGHRGALPISVPAMGTLVLSAQPGLMDFLDQANTEDNIPPSIERSIIQSGVLPEGVYQLCVEAYDYNGPRRLSGPNAGCSTIPLLYAAPPAIVQPANGGFISNLNPAPVFTWTPPLGNTVGARISYELVVTPVFDGQDPNDAIIAARSYQRGNPVILKEGLRNTVYVRQPADLPFQAGRTYAMQVTAQDDARRIVISNLGRSSVHVFTVGSGIGTPPKPPIVPQPLPPLEPHAPEIAQGFLDRNLDGELYYYWSRQGRLTTTDGSQAANIPTIQSTPNTPTGAMGTAGGSTPLQGHTDGNRIGYSDLQRSPLAGITVQLVQALQLRGAVSFDVNTNGTSLLPGNVLAGMDGFYSAPGNYVPLPVLATTTTAADGSFRFNVPDLQALDLAWKTGPINLVSAFSGEFQGHVRQEGWRRVLMVRIGTDASQYYLQPIQYNERLPANNNLGAFYCSVATYNATVQVGEFANPAVTKAGMEVLLMRRSALRPSLVPKDETAPGDFSDNERIQLSGGGNFEILATAVTDAQGRATFNDLVAFPRYAYGGAHTYWTHVRPVDAHHTVHSLSSNAQEVRYASEADWRKCSPQADAACRSNNAGYCTRITRECHGPDLPTFHGYERSYSSGSEQAEHIHHIHTVQPLLPAITATVKNRGAGTQGDAARNEPGAPWSLYRINEATKNYLRDQALGLRWGQQLENYSPSQLLHLNYLLVQQGLQLTHERSGRTGADGRIHERALPAYGIHNGESSPRYFRLLTVNKSGFAPVYRRVAPLATPNADVGDTGPNEAGRTYPMGELWLDPNGKLELRLRNADGAAIAGSAYYFDPATGQQGSIRNSRSVIPQGGGLPLSVVELSVPSGATCHVVVVPQDLNTYDRDTLVLNVPSSGTRIVPVTLPWKLHRLHFHVESAGNPSIRLSGARIELLHANAQHYPDERCPHTMNDLVEAEQSNGGPVLPLPLLGTPDVQGNNATREIEEVGVPSTTPSGSIRPVGSTPPDLSPHIRYTNAGGAADMAFRSSARSFTIRVYSPDELEYITQEVQVNSTPAQQWTTVSVRLPEGRRVRGRVSLDSAAVAGAQVRYTYQGLTNQATTDARGQYELRRVPKGVDLTFTCSKPGYVGVEYTEGQENALPFGSVRRVVADMPVGARSISVTTIDLRLKVYGGMDFHRLLGFPLEVTRLTELPGGRVRINAWVSVPDSANAVFRLTAVSSEGERLDVVRITDIEVQPDPAARNSAGIPLAAPASLPIALAVNNVAVGIHPRGNGHTYHGRLGGNGHSVLLDRRSGDARGLVQGNVYVDNASFSDNNFALDGNGTLRLLDPADGMLSYLPVFTSTATAYHPAAAGMGVVGANGKDLSYTLHGFQARSISNGSRLYRDSLVLETRLHTALAHVPAPHNDLRLAIGNITLKDGSLQAFNSDRSFALQLGAHSLSGNSLSMDASGFRFTGTLRASGLQLPVEAGRLYPDRLDAGAMAVRDITLIDAIPATAHYPAVLGFDAVRPEPAWYLAISSGDHATAAITISGEQLDGIPNDRSIGLSSLWLYGNGDQETSMVHDMPAFPLYGVASASVQQVLLAPGLLTLSAAIDLGIPGFPTYASALLYNKQGNGTGPMHLQPFNMPPIAINGVQLAFDKQGEAARVNNNGDSHSIRFQPGRFTITGGISDRDPEVFKDLRYTLTRSAEATHLSVDRAPRQSVRLGGNNSDSRIVLGDVEGSMQVNGNGVDAAWNHFYLKGDMPTEMGFEPTAEGPQRMRFEVRGDLSVQDQQIKLKDIETPFGNINMQYDALHHRLSGQLNVGTQVSGGPSLNGSAAIVMDRDGYYFLTGLNAQLSDPQMQGSAFLLLGDYARRTVQMDAMLLQYSIYGQRMLQRRAGAMVHGLVMAQLAQNPATAMALAHSSTEGRVLPRAYTDLFSSGRFNGFYVACGARMPFPGIPSFSIDCSPIAQVEFGVEIGADVRLGANFGGGIYTVGFDTYMDAAMGGGGSMAVFCFHGRIGVHFDLGMAGTFRSSGDWRINAQGQLELTGSFTLGGGVCSVPCDDWTCMHFTVGGSIGMGLIGEFSNTGSDFRLVLGNVNTSNDRYDPPPPPSNE